MSGGLYCQKGTWILFFVSKNVCHMPDDSFIQTKSTMNNCFCIGPSIHGRGGEGEGKGDTIMPMAAILSCKMRAQTEAQKSHIPHEWSYTLEQVDG